MAVLPFADVARVALEVVMASRALRTTRINGAYGVFLYIGMFFGGAIEPLPALRTNLQVVCQCSPFCWRFGYTAALVVGTGSPEDLPRTLVTLTAWSVAATILGNKLWKRGLRTWESVGG